MENLRNRVNLQLVWSHKTDKILRLVARPEYAMHKIFGNDLAGIRMFKSELFMNTPVYTGIISLENSKILKEGTTESSR